MQIVCDVRVEAKPRSGLKYHPALDFCKCWLTRSVERQSKYAKTCRIVKREGWALTDLFKSRQTNYS